ncbi:uncharacterized protein [Rutidosis leptorrhynchoides]|uniref:uncharacterized protein n=1 Tax=Rutidosis leptorrhynchoides TaxID=125765 RepID=UPI003A9983AB
MGCCISKSVPKRKLHSNSLVQDKLVISQSPPSTPSRSPSRSPPKKQKINQSPPSITSSSFTCSTQTSTCNSSLLSSASSFSSIALSKENQRSFSNDFLQSCAMENPQIIGLDQIKKSGQVLKPLSQGSSQKRARATSPILTRQKSFRVEKQKMSNTMSIVNGRNTMRSPSPSRRFNGNSSSNYQRQPMLYLNNMMQREINDSNRILKPIPRVASPNRNVISNERSNYLKNKERFGYQIGSKVEGVGIGQVLTKVDYSGPIPMEDLDNPHIALDCFIFL